MFVPLFWLLILILEILNMEENKFSNCTVYNIYFSYEFIFTKFYYFLFVDQRSMYYVAQVHKLTPTTFAKYILDVILIVLNHMSFFPVKNLEIFLVTFEVSLDSILYFYYNQIQLYWRDRRRIKSFLQRIWWGSCANITKGYCELQSPKILEQFPIFYMLLKSGKPWMFISGHLPYVTEHAFNINVFPFLPNYFFKSKLCVHVPSHVIP